MSNRLDNTTSNGFSLLNTGRARKNSRRNKHAAPTLEQLEPRLLLSVPSTWTSMGVGGTGTTYYPRFNPWTATPGTELWVGTDMGQVFHTTTFTDYADTSPKLGHIGQVTWNTPAVSGLSIVVPEYGHNASTVYCWAVGGLYKSTDGGSTFPTKLTLPSSVNSVPEKSNFFVDTTNANDRMVFMGDDHKAYISTNGGGAWTVVNGGSDVTWISGVTWASNGTDVYIGINNNTGDSTRGLLKGTYSGGTWAWSWVTRSGLATGEAFNSVVGLYDGGTLRFMAVAKQYDKVGNNGNPGNPTKVYSWSVGDGAWVDRTGAASVDGIEWVRGGQTSGGTPYFYLGSQSNVGANVWKGTWSAGTWSGWTDILDAANFATSYQTATGASLFDITVCPNNPDFIVWVNEQGVYGTTTATTATAHWACISCDRNYRNPEGVNGVAGQAYASTLNETTVWGLNFLDQNTVFSNNTDQNLTYTTNGGISWATPQLTWAAPYDFWKYNTVYKSATAYDGTALLAISGAHDDANSDDLADYFGWSVLLATPDNGKSVIPVLDPAYDFVNRSCDFQSKMNGGKFQGSNDLSNWYDLASAINGNVPYTGGAGWNGTVTSTNNTATVRKHDCEMRSTFAKNWPAPKPANAQTSSATTCC